MGVTHVIYSQALHELRDRHQAEFDTIYEDLLAANGVETS
jgi:hypothetical protein